MIYYIFRKLGMMFDKFVEGFLFGLGLYGLYSFGKWMGWF